MPKLNCSFTAHSVVAFFRRRWYGSELIGANRRGKVPAPVRFESAHALSLALAQALATERVSVLKKLFNRSHWGDTGAVQMMYLEQAREVVNNILKGADQGPPQPVDDLANQLAEALQCLESIARNDASDTDGFATASVRRVRASLFAHSQPKASWACIAWRKLAPLF